MTIDIVEDLRADELPDERQSVREARIVLHKKLNAAADEIERLREKCNKQAMVFQRLIPDKFPGVYFIHGEIGEKDQNGMPEKLLVVPAYGVDFSYVYEYTGKTTGPEW